MDGGTDVVIEAVQYDRHEAASHAYHQPDAPVVMPLELEDAPTTPPPAASLTPPREPKERRHKQTQSRRPAATDDEGVVIYSYEIATADREKKSVNAQTDKSNEAREERAAAKQTEKPKRDPVAESFLRAYPGSGSYSTPTRY